MKKLLQVFLLSSIMSNVCAAPAPPPPPVGQPLPYYDLDVKWVILNNVKYENKLFYACKRYVVFNQTECEKNGYTAKEVLNKMLGAGSYEPVGLSPYVNSAGNQLGIVLYYK